MPRPRNPHPSVPLELAIPADLRARLDLYLYSEVEQRVPHGAYSAFILPLIREALDRRNAATPRTLP